MSEDNIDLVFKLLCKCILVWGIYFDLLNFVYENLVYDVVVYVCFRKYLKKSMKVEFWVMKKK